MVMCDAFYLREKMFMRVPFFFLKNELCVGDFDVM